MYCNYYCLIIIILDFEKADVREPKQLPFLAGAGRGGSGFTFMFNDLNFLHLYRTVLAYCGKRNEKINFKKLPICWAIFRFAAVAGAAITKMGDPEPPKAGEGGERGGRGSAAPQHWDSQHRSAQRMPQLHHDHDLTS